MDAICIDNLEVWTHIGITSQERSVEQRLLLSIEIFLDTTKAAVSDNVEDTINYFSVCSRLRELAKTERNTLERFAEDIATMILDEFSPPGGTKVTIRKFIIPDTECTRITIQRSR